MVKKADLRKSKMAKAKLKATKSTKAKGPKPAKATKKQVTKVPSPKKRGRPPAKALPAQKAAPKLKLAAKLASKPAVKLAAKPAKSAPVPASRGTLRAVWTEAKRLDEEALQGKAPKPTVHDVSDDEIADVISIDSDSEVVPWPETPPPEKPAQVKKELACSPVRMKSAAAVVDLEPDAAPSPAPSVPGMKQNLKELSSDEIEAAWQGDGLAHPEKNFLVREVPMAERDTRECVRVLVQRAICSSPDSYAKYEQDYIDTFCRDASYRVLASYVNGQICGGLAIKLVPESDPKGVYLEFMGTKKGCHVGKPTVKQLKQWVKKHPTLDFIALNSLDPAAVKRNADHANHTSTFWSERGFGVLETLTLGRLTSAIEPERGVQRPYRIREYYKRFEVPEGGPTTIPMLWVPSKPRGEW